MEGVPGYPHTLNTSHPPSLGHWESFPSKGSDLQGFYLLPLNRLICRKIEKGQAVQAHYPVKSALVPGSSGYRWEKESGLPHSREPAAPGGSAQDSEAVTPGLNQFGFFSSY